MCNTFTILPSKLFVAIYNLYIYIFITRAKARVINSVDFFFRAKLSLPARPIVLAISDWLI